MPVRGLWKGLTPSMARVFIGASAYFGALHVISRSFRKKDGSLDMWLGLACGAGARSMATVLAMPMGVIKTRLEASTHSYSNIWRGVADMWKTESMYGLFRGTLPTILRDAPSAGVYLALYEQLKPLLMRTLPDETPGMVVYGVASFSAGAGSTLISHPLDVIKTHMQLVTGSERMTMAATVKRVFAEEGIAGFLVGFPSRMLRKPVALAFTWTCYDLLTGAGKKDKAAGEPKLQEVTLDDDDDDTSSNTK